MKRTQSRVRMLMIPLALILLIGLGGCGGVYVDGGPEWDGNIFFTGVHDHDDRYNAFHAGGSHWSAGQSSARGRTSMGPRAGGGHAPSGGGHAPSGGGHAPSGGGGHAP